MVQSERLKIYEGLDALGLQYVLSVQLTTLVWPPGVQPIKPGKYKGTGRKPTRQRIAKGYEPLQIEKLALSLESKQWRRLTWAEGSNGRLSSHFAFARVRVAPKNHLSRPLQEEQWLIIEWPEGEDKPTKYWLSNLPASSTKQQLVKSAKVRWRIERDYQEMKQGLGLNQYEGRNWRGFHHHASLCIASYGFLIIQRLKYPERKKNDGKRKKPTRRIQTTRNPNECSAMFVIQSRQYDGYWRSPSPSHLIDVLAVATQAVQIS